jgi:oligopeptide transport system substrate-binding protein
MKQKNQGRLGALLLLMLILPILAACGGAPVGGEPGAAATTPPAAEATAAPADAGAAAPTEPPAAEPAAPTAAEPAPSGASDPAGNVLRIAESVWPDTLNPQKASFANEIAMLILNYEGLTKFDKELKTVPAAAESWEYNEDATEISFKLRAGLTYSDGSPLTGQDFVKAVHRTLDPRTPGNYQSSLSMIKGAEEVIAASPDDAAMLEELFSAVAVSAPDEQTVTFELIQPTPYFHTLAALWVMYPAKQELIDKGGEQWYEDAANQIGNGPFKVTTIDRGNNLIEYVPNENYWGGRPTLDGIQLKFIDDLAVAFQAYKAGEVDIVIPDPNDIPTIKADPVLGKELQEYAGACSEVYGFNLTKEPFNNQKVREAFAHAFDREAYIRDAIKDTSVKTLTWIPPGYPGYDQGETRYDLDPAKAKQLLAEAGYPDGQGLPEIKWTYNSNNPANQARVEYIVQMIQQNLGVSVVPDPVEGTTLVNMRKDVSTYPQITADGWCADYPDPQNWLSIYWHSRSGNAQDVGYSNAEVDQLLDQADVEIDEARRMELYAQAQKLIIADSPMIVRSVAKNIFLVKPYVKNLDFTPQDADFPGMMVGLNNVTLEK